jgi:hypothetical protein
LLDVATTLMEPLGDKLPTWWWIHCDNMNDASNGECVTHNGIFKFFKTHLQLVDTKISSWLKIMPIITRTTKKKDSSLGNMTNCTIHKRWNTKYGRTQV